MVLADDPDPLRRFLTDAFEDRGLMWRPDAHLAVTCEDPIASGADAGRMDVTVVVDGRDKIRIEIKFDDHFIDGQLDKELSVVRKEGSFFLVLTKLPLKKAEMIRLGNAGAEHRFFADLSPYLHHVGGQASTMLLDCLKEKGLLMDDIDTHALDLFVHRLLKPWKGGGRAATHSLKAGPAQLSTLMNNLALISADLGPKISRRSGQNRAATIDLWMRPAYKPHGLAAAIAEASRDGDDEVHPESDHRAGGVVTISASHALGTSRNHLYLSYGLYLSTYDLQTKTVAVSLFASMSGSELRKNRAKNDGDAWIEIEKPMNHALRKMKDKKPDLAGAFSSLLSEVIEEETKRKLVRTAAYRKQLRETARLLC